MAREKHLYVDYLSSYLDSFINILKEGGRSGISIDKEKLIGCGNREDYKFRLEMFRLFFHNLKSQCSNYSSFLDL